MSNPVWLSIASAEIGVKEDTSKGSNPRIEEYQKAGGQLHPDDDVPWCASFVSFCMVKAGYQFHSTAARSWLGFGKSVKPTIAGAPIPVGAVTVLWRGDRNGPHGHVGFYLGPDPKDPKAILMLGGNQGNQVAIHSYPFSRVLDYRWPS